MIATFLFFGFNIQNVIATDCDILSNALTSFSSTVKNEMDKVTDCCQFNGVTCNAQKQIVSLKFSKVINYQLTLEQFFNEIANLSQLSTIELSNITGKINAGLPSTIGNLKSVKNFSSLMGFSSIPESIGNLTNLEKLDLSNNFINGKLPKVLASLSNLKYLDLSDNHIKGYIPYEFKNLNKLENL
ncbi:hypothetical protein PIROE2DRAFT_11540 [Piromyces sp. E2]|nr:hypothetical protein PIROE2DRAFT_11540 [Piromyces sp. E2]|eukprot:OUM62226.1 hypothetical protein PIROE2DRAFT_11540 [Piromyces sp. E2]